MPKREVDPPAEATYIEQEWAALLEPVGGARLVRSPAMGRGGSSRPPLPAIDRQQRRLQPVRRRFSQRSTAARLSILSSVQERPARKRRGTQGAGAPVLYRAGRRDRSGNADAGL